MNKINKTGHYSKYDSRQGSFRGAFDQDMDQSIQEEHTNSLTKVKKPSHSKKQKQNLEESRSPKKEGDSSPATVKKEERVVSKMAGISTTKNDRRGKVVEKDAQKLLGNQRAANNTTSRMDSILSVLASNAELSSKKGQMLLRGDSTNSHLLPTQNSMQKDPFDVSSAIIS